MWIVVVICILTVNQINPLSVNEEWNKWKEMYGRKYRSLLDEEDAKSNFVKTHEIIQAHNEKYDSGEETWKMGHNQFSTWSDEEFQSILKIDTEPEIEGRGLSTINIPFDWRPSFADNRVWDIPVKNQGSCPCCSAFCAAGLLEYVLYKQYGKYYDLSEQHMFDCAPKGRTRLVYNYAIENGICFEDVYPYTKQLGTCQFPGKIKDNQIGVFSEHFPRKYYTLPRDEVVMAYAVEKYGWISVPINATMFKFYQSGVMPASDCRNIINHAVLIVGYGTDPYTGLDYWLIRNSWGSEWGEDGYMKLERNANACDILNKAGDRAYFDLS